MSKQVEYRVRPAVRYIVTRYESGTSPDGGSYGQCETAGEFANEEQAERVKAALEDGDPAMERVNGYMVVRNGHDIGTEAYFAHSLGEATALHDRLENETQVDWVVTRRLA